ncbi:hypothetical protein, partial [Bacteroides heparinolyticus]|uniref:hypothetical protein n=1 Tax=Prevotella heparinolytica TaxID=28113 RepID=UPI00403A3206
DTPPFFFRESGYFSGAQLFLSPRMRIIYRVVQSTTFLALHGLLRDEVAHVYHVAQFAQFARGFGAQGKPRIALHDRLSACGEIKRVVLLKNIRFRGKRTAVCPEPE